jgi:CheY-like chemotaxis protein
MKGLRIESQISPEIPSAVRGDSHRLRQILTNLTANAIKFTETGGITVAVAPESQTDASVTLRFTITDTGIGLKPDQAARLFSPFVQADASTTRKYGGTGLGLAISKELAGLMGGTIGVDSRPGEGSTFWFTAVLDIVPSRLASLPIPDQRVPVPSEVATPQIRDARILVAEDNAVNQYVALAQLQKLGYRASAVNNGAEAVAAVKDGDWDLVLMDCQMPLMDGFEATRRIRQGLRPDIPIIALTANAMESDREQCLREGMNDYLAKPMDLEHLANVIARWTKPRGIAPKENKMNIFNPDALLRRLMGDRQIAGIILGGFLADAPSQLKALSELIDNADAPGVRLQAHSLKGAAATVAAEELQATLLAMETAAHGGQLEKCAELLPHATRHLAQFRSAIECDGWITTPADNGNVDYSKKDMVPEEMKR